MYPLELLIYSLCGWPHLTGAVPGNPLSQDILNLYQEADGTRKLLNYMLDNLAGNGCCQIYQRTMATSRTHSTNRLVSTRAAQMNCPVGFCVLFCAVHPEQLPQRPWITLKERDQMIPSGTSLNRIYSISKLLLLSVKSIIIIITSQQFSCICPIEGDSNVTLVAFGRLTAVG